MAKKNFNWKGLFINDENASEDNTSEIVVPDTSTNSFPESTSSGSKFPEHTPKAVTKINNDTLGGIIEMYQSGFDSLNQPGYDFYEFFKAIKAVGTNEPSIYKMALTMAKSVDAKVSKKTLLTEADFYIKEIEKVHKQYQNQGAKKKSQILSNQKTQKSNLTAEISALEKNLMEIQNQISIKKNQLQSLDNSSTDLSDLNQKIMANDAAKSKILETIVTVVDGIKNNL